MRAPKFETRLAIQTARKIGIAIGEDVRSGSAKSFASIDGGAVPPGTLSYVAARCRTHFGGIFLMSEISKAVSVYQAVFRKEPRPQTLHILQSMELAFGLQEDELLTHLVVSQLRIADRFESLFEKRLSDEDVHNLKIGHHVKDLEEVVANIKKLTFDFKVERERLKQRPAWSVYPSTDPLGMVNRTPSFPVLRYLAGAFPNQNGDYERDERIRAARWSIIFMLELAIALVLTPFLMWWWIHG